MTSRHHGTKKKRKSNLGAQRRPAGFNDTVAGRKPAACGAATTVMLICRRLSAMRAVIVLHRQFPSEREAALVWHKLPTC